MRTKNFVRDPYPWKWDMSAEGLKAPNQAPWTFHIPVQRPARLHIAELASGTTEVRAISELRASVPLLNDTARERELRRLGAVGVGGQVRFVRDQLRRVVPADRR